MTLYIVRACRARNAEGTLLGKARQWITRPAAARIDAVGFPAALLGVVSERSCLMHTMRDLQRNHRGTHMRTLQNPASAPGYCEAL